MGFLGTRSRTDNSVTAGPSDDDFRLALDMMPQLGWMTDKDGKPIWYNKRWHEYTGLTIDDVRKHGREYLLHPDHAHRVMDNLKSYFASGQEWEDMFPLKAKNGEYHWFLSRAQPMRNAQSKRRA